MRRLVKGGRLRRGRTGSGGLLLLFGRSWAVGEGWLGANAGLGRTRKEKLGTGQKKAQNGIKTRDISMTISAGFKKKNYLVFCLIEILNKRHGQRKKKSNDQVDGNISVVFPKKEKKKEDKLTTQSNDTSCMCYFTSIRLYKSPSFINLCTVYASLNYDSETYQS